MLAWLKRRARREEVPAPTSEPAAPQGHGMAEAYLSLHRYLANRYSDVVVLTFAQVEDLLGSPLPAPAKQDPAWWNSDDDRNFGHSNSWRLAQRTAVANLAALTVTFERSSLGGSKCHLLRPPQATPAH
jgi:hypothetical protein